jgi:hypothetical protein
VSRRAGQIPGVVEVRLSSAAEDTGILISVLERLATGLPVTTVALEILYRSGARANRRDPGERAYVLVRVCQDGGRRTREPAEQAERSPDRMGPDVRGHRRPR